MGKKVRSAIHDSINAMNIESSNAMEYARTAQDSAAASATAAGESATTALGAKADALLAAGRQENQLQPHWELKRMLLAAGAGRISYNRIRS